MEIIMPRIKNKDLIKRIEQIEQKLPNQIDQIHKNVKEIKEKLKIDKK